MNLRKILGYTEKEKLVDEHEMIARSTVRSLTLQGFEAYDLWRIAEEMLELALNPHDHPTLFPPNQRVTPKHYPAK